MDANNVKVAEGKTQDKDKRNNDIAYDIEEYTVFDNDEDDIAAEITTNKEANAEMIDATDHRRRDVKWTFIHGNWRKEVT